MDIYFFLIFFRCIIMKNKYFRWVKTVPSPPPSAPSPTPQPSTTPVSPTSLCSASLKASARRDAPSSPLPGDLPTCLSRSWSARTCRWLVARRPAHSRWILWHSLLIRFLITCSHKLIMDLGSAPHKVLF